VIPPRREDILNVLRSSRSLLDGFGVARLSLFGSFARDEGGEDSDVDLLVEFNRPIGLFEFVRLQRQLGELIATESIS
jgi:predicted nucleotidyltransferase